MYRKEEDQLENLKKVVLKDIEANDYQSALKIIGQELYKSGFVHDGYVESVIEREGNYPTGLPSSMPSIAIPHTDHKFVKTTSLGIATLKSPVKFHNMENPKEKIDVSIIIMLAIAEPKGQIEMLQKVVSLISDEALRKEIIAADSETKLTEIMNKLF